MKLYFASASANWKEVRIWMQFAMNNGHEITFDWTQMVENRPEPYDLAPTNGDMQQLYKDAAHNDRVGVFDCQALVNIWTGNQCGALLETGMGIALGKDIWIADESVDNIRFSVFWELPQVTLMTFKDLENRLTAKEAHVRE